MSRRNAPEIFFFLAVRGCPRPCARTNPWFRGQILGEKCAQEPTPSSAVKHCQFLDTGGGGTTRCAPPPPPLSLWGKGKPYSKAQPQLPTVAWH